MAIKTFTEQLRDAIRDSGQSRYAISQATGIPQSRLSTFINGKSGLSLANIDRLCDHFQIGLTSHKRRKG